MRLVAAARFLKQTPQVSHLDAEVLDNKLRRNRPLELPVNRGHAA